MGISISIIILVYLVVLALGYIASIYAPSSQTSFFIINKSYTNAFFVLFIAIALAFLMIALPFIPVDKNYAAGLILGSKFISIITLFISLFVLSRKYLKQPPIS
ncbi:hypothetical protein DRW41_04020 [Neobacillus piezotolerans]|uniref:Uncharacterized protein n=1 Tax=Neobacillus piezotolerans TaxID=2259171 RepID=A0A3D8GW96_9BACI|nr:hypothetical protein [Neobacillus piezotolerans]RDU38734.1 hypothetical protein DRW41_04020 [Neobacillus piezotolerans]